ncbi:MAG: Lrp/AsnC family transcriptional regulator [Fimbriimonadaceae bacterium]|nr:Lrp/AsnC family transcriptional regulator [Fimbriimonadaceae bacterium]
MKTLLDETDIRILNILQRDGRITNADLAKEVGLSAPSVLQRVRQLEHSGYIRGYTALLNPEKLGKRVLIWAQVSLALHQDQPIERFIKAIRQIPEVMECYHVSGEYDFLIKVLVDDIRTYEVVVREKLMNIKGIGKLTSSFVLGTNKHSTVINVE